MERIFTKEKNKIFNSKHEFFDTLIQEKAQHLSIDDLEIIDLKNKIKDEINKLANN